jgi:hypothetical protein
MSIHVPVVSMPERDELEPRSARYIDRKDGTLAVARGGFVGFSPSLAGDCEETAVRIEIPSKSGGTVFVRLVVLHRGDDVEDVMMPEGFRALAEAAGIPSHCNAFEGYLETLARLEFARRGGR